MAKKKKKNPEPEYKSVLRVGLNYPDDDVKQAHPDKGLRRETWKDKALDKIGLLFLVVGLWFLIDLVIGPFIIEPLGLGRMWLYVIALAIFTPGYLFWRKITKADSVAPKRTADGKIHNPMDSPMYWIKWGLIGMVVILLIGLFFVLKEIYF